MLPSSCSSRDDSDCRDVSLSACAVDVGRSLDRWNEVTTWQTRLAIPFFAIGIPPVAWAWEKRCASDWQAWVPDNMLMEKYGSSFTVLVYFSVAAVGGLGLVFDWSPLVASRAVFSASASLDGRRKENDIKGSGCKATEENEDNVAPWYEPSANLATTTDTG
ncbi:hypothetical protein QFC21_002287 [Naganishia friedmannii]|uniref:Uncharacterized protein n=1 Tax=Naganishia friedmannii TaxID=89922 RepID=A0ACC2VWI9_9TREE|nr:hypothetical protein QFC21_002287 [Naganishia friedmannii]